MTIRELRENLTIRELREDLALDRRYWIPQDPRGNGIVGQFARGLLCPVVLVVTFQKHPALEKLLRDCYNCPNPRIDRDRETLHEYKVLTYLFVSRLVSTMRSFFEPIGIYINTSVLCPTVLDGVNSVFQKDFYQPLKIQECFCVIQYGLS